MSVSDLTNTTWVFSKLSGNNIGDLVAKSINGVVVGTSVDLPNFNGIKVNANSQIQFYADFYMSGDKSWETASSLFSTPLTINITGGTDATDSTLISWIETNATQMTVTNLTDTTWVINSLTCSAGYGQFNIYGTCYDSNGDYKTPGANISYLYIGYTLNFDSGYIPTANSININTGPTYLAVGDVLVFDNTNAGPDATNSTLISWLEANATQLLVTDLTNTTWVFNNTLSNIQSMSQGYEYTYYINFVSNNSNYSSLTFIYDIGSDPGDGVVRNQGLSYDGYGKVYNSRYDTWENVAFQTIEISGGTDATNSTLIIWLQSNATQQVAPTVISTCKVGDKNIIKKMYGIKEIVKEVLNGSVIYQK